MILYACTHTVDMYNVVRRYLLFPFARAYSLVKPLRWRSVSPSVMRACRSCCFNIIAAALPSLQLSSYTAEKLTVWDVTMLYSILEELRLSMTNCGKTEDGLLQCRRVCIRVRLWEVLLDQLSCREKWDPDKGLSVWVQLLSPRLLS